ncbi:unnamed protein product [Cyclocybe aegerita]|uniref:Uncharacterized protein n=1 Tax=Cyclocybe aegerita TaxID=1973307 RepID=A0A8S0VYV9_CYCAE|nr:unnamed protein product [Cyclocybe aegerita]
MEFPAFSEYQDVFSAPLPTSMLVIFVNPLWIPVQPALLKIAKAAYSYWKECRVKQGGHHIIPTLNGDESDTLNEFYICFRWRESKAVRKTRAQQENAIQAQALWEKRQAFANLKRKFPSLNEKINEELLVDKEQPVKKLEVVPKERLAMIREQIKSQLARQKDIDHHWDDQIDNPYQTHPAPYACRLFKYIPPPGAPAWPLSSSDKTNKDSTPPSLPPPHQSHAAHMCYGRGGSRQQHLEERWKYDLDDVPPVGPEGADEQDRILVDDYGVKYLQHSMTLHLDPDHLHLVTNPTLILTNSEGRQHAALPYCLDVYCCLFRP